MDCGNMITYMREEKRMCEWYCENYKCEKCPLANVYNHSCQKLFHNDNGITNATESYVVYMIEKVQKWSDEHKELQ